MAFQLQFGPRRTHVQEVLDRHLASLPPEAQQNRDDRLWRLALHRMDARKYTVEQVDLPASVEKDTSQT